MNKKLIIAIFCIVSGFFLVSSGVKEMYDEEEETEALEKEKHLFAPFKIVTVEGDIAAGDVENLEADLHKIDLEVLVWEKDNLHYRVEKIDAGKRKQKIDVKNDDGKTLYFSEEKDGKLDRMREIRRNRPRAVITLYVPENFSFNSFKVEAGVGRVVLKSFKISEKMEAKFAVASLDAEGIIANNVRIEGGVGSLLFKNCVFNNASFESDVGSINYKGELKGEVNFSSGVGSVKCALKGSADAWEYDISRGIASVSINGKSFSSRSFMSSAHKVPEKEKAVGVIRVSSGIGAVSLSFEE